MSDSLALGDITDSVGPFWLSLEIGVGFTLAPCAFGWCETSWLPSTPSGIVWRQPMVEANIRRLLVLVNVQDGTKRVKEVIFRSITNFKYFKAQRGGGTGWEMSYRGTLPLSEPKVSLAWQGLLRRRLTKIIPVTLTTNFEQPRKIATPLRSTLTLYLLVSFFLL